MNGADVTLATVRAGATHASDGAGQAPRGATALGAPRVGAPGARLGRRNWATLLSCLLAVAVTAVSIPLLAVLYDIFVPLTFLLAAVHGAAVVLALSRPALAIGLSGWAIVLIALLGLGASGLPHLPWPLPVVTLITQVLVCALIALRGEVRPALAALAVSVAASSVPLVVTLADGDLWATALPNLLTFHCIAVLVTAAGLLASRVTVGE